MPRLGVLLVVPGGVAGVLVGLTDGNLQDEVVTIPLRTTLVGSVSAAVTGLLALLCISRGGVEITVGMVQIVQARGTDLG